MTSMTFWNLTLISNLDFVPATRHFCPFPLSTSTSKVGSHVQIIDQAWTFFIDQAQRSLGSGKE